MSLTLGIVGLPNVGKSTLFNALTKNQVPAENYPFCTIDPNHGTVALKDSRIDKLAEIEKSAKKIYATIEFVDIAGIVKGAATGAGLGNKFLSEIMNVDAIVQVVRIFENSDILHVNNKVDPSSDIETINLELILKDLEIIEKVIDRIQKESRVNPKYRHYLDFLQEIKLGLENGKLAKDIISTKKSFDFDDEVFKVEYKQLQLLTNKPFLFVANVSENSEFLKTGANLDKLKELMKLDTNAVIIPLCIKLEFELSSLDESDKVEFLKEYGLSEIGLDKLTHESYKLLNLISFLTTGPDETRAWTIVNGTNARDASGVIHTDFIKKFIMAEVTTFEDFVQLGGYKGCKEHGKLRMESKDYIVKDGDICEFKIGG